MPRSRTLRALRRRHSPAQPATPGELPQTRTLLMVLYHFPPVGGVSMARNIRNVQYLPQHGWIPIVLTPHETAGGLQDTEALALIPQQTRILRTRIVEAGHVRQAALRVRDLVSSLRGSHLDRLRSTGITPTELDVSTDRNVTAGSPLRLGSFRHLFFFPDDQVAWLPFAVLAALRLQRRTRIDAVFSTSSPITAHLIGGIMKKLTGLPWVVELRDPWVGNALATPLPWLHRRIQVKLERWIITSADLVVCVTPTLARLYQRRYPRATVLTIPNGYDRSEKLERSPDAAGSTRFRIVYAGTLDRPTELRVFLAGLETLVDRRPDMVSRVEVVFYGSVADVCREIVDAHIAGRLGGMLRFAGFAPRRVALQAIADADAALVLLGNGPGMDLFVGGKLYDYIGQDRQVLAMLPDGDARDLLEDLDWGIIADPDPVHVADAVEQLIAAPTTTRPADPAGHYDRAVLAGLLADALTAAAVDTRASQGPGS